MLMKVYPETRSKVQPDTKVIDDYSVWIATNIRSISEPGVSDIGDSGFEGYEYTLTQYDKDEYIKMMDDKSAALEETLNDTQLALTTLYEAMA